MKVETSDDKPVVPVSIPTFQWLMSFDHAPYGIIDYHNLLELLMLHICIEKKPW